MPSEMSRVTEASPCKSELPAVGIARRILGGWLAPLMRLDFAEGKRMRAMSLALHFRHHTAQPGDEPCIDGFGQDYEPVAARRQALGARAEGPRRGERPAVAVFEARRQFAAQTVEIKTILASFGDFDWNDRAFAPAQAGAHTAFRHKRFRVDERRGRCSQSKMPRRFRRLDRDTVDACAQVSLQKRVMPRTVVRRVGEVGQECVGQAQGGFQPAQRFDPIEPAFGNRQFEAAFFVTAKIEMVGLARGQCGERRTRNERHRRSRPVWLPSRTR